MKQIDAVILAGGKGSRIKSYLGKNPKPLVKLGNRSFLEYLNIFLSYLLIFVLLFLIFHYLHYFECE